MNRIMKGTIAIGAAAALLLGGAGSLAYWQHTDQIEADALTFETGAMSLITFGQSWTVNGVEMNHDEVQDVRMVPGTTVVVTSDYSIDMYGTELHAVLDASIGGLTATSAPDWENPDAELIPTDAFDALVPTVTVVGDQVERTSTWNVFNIKGSGGVKVVITFEWPYGETPDNATMGKQVNLGDVVVTLKQVPEALEPQPCAC